MKVRCVALAFVSAVYFAGLAASPGSAFAATPTPASRLVQAGYTALQQGDAARAIPLFTQSIDTRELAPDSLANALFNRGLAYQTLGQGGNAVDDYTAALNLDAMPSDLRARVLYNRGLTQQKLGHGALAIEDFTGALLIDGSFSHAYLARANALRESGQYLFSISDYERALKYKHPEAAQVYYGEGQTYEFLKRPADAKRLYQKALSIQPSFEAAASRLQALGSVVDNDELASDPVLSTAMAGVNPVARTEVVAQALPKAIEPPAKLLEVTAAPPVVQASQVAASKPVTNEAKVVVASVPKIPSAPAAKAAPADPIQTASTEPAKVKPAAKPAPATTGWVVQISSAASEAAAWASFETMQKDHKVLRGLEPAVVQADLGAKGTVYRVRLQGFDAQADAKTACDKLQDGGVECFIAKVAG